jgi:hypothetical protein
MHIEMQPLEIDEPVKFVEFTGIVVYRKANTLERH